MSAGKGNIPITLKYKGDSYAIRTHINEYYSLMTVIADHLAISGLACVVVWGVAALPG